VCWLVFYTEPCLAVRSGQNSEMMSYAGNQFPVAAAAAAAVAAAAAAAVDVE
jgi:hypothetical protein